ncbi:MAG: sigma-54 dependent transcriptional regulator [Desulfobacterales bacterium]|nr:sigma-54 dependent transcriptional regulator [Desulfobacterales bacterium]
MNSRRPRLLIVDDEPDMLRLLTRSVGQDLDCEVITAGNGRDALACFEAQPFDLALLDIRMPGMDGLQLLEEIQARRPGFTVVMMTAFGAIEVAVNAIRKGAYDFITKPFDHDELVHHLQNALERGRLLNENRALKARVSGAEAFQGLVGASPAMQAVFDRLAMLGKSDITVLITGASGTGKNLAARALHDLSSRREGPFVRVSCPTVPENILESELFGYAKGAFTHAITDRRGLFQEADGGTLFLDEIGDISPAIQAKLLQVLEDKEFRPLGRNRSVKVDVRMVAATNSDLKARMAAGEFREDLYYRLCVVEVGLPPLSERPDDIPLLVDHFLTRHSPAAGEAPKRVPQELMAQLVAHPWPGNVRELENLIRRGVVMSGGEDVTPEAIGWQAVSCVADLETDDLSDIPYREAKEEVLSQFNRRYIRKALEMTGGNVTRAAKRSRIERQSFQQIMRKYDIRSEAFRTGAKK